MGLDPDNLYPSVRCGLEGALLTALAQAHSMPLASLLQGQQAAPHHASAADLAQPDEAVLVNGLLDCGSDVEACTQEALHMVAQGYTALKIKVYTPLNGCTYSDHGRVQCICVCNTYQI